MDGSNRWRSLRGYIGLSLAWLAILAAVLLLTRQPAGQPIEILPPPTLPPTATPGPLRVDVAGAVRTSGIYTLSPGSLIADAIAAAGGPADDADLDRLNKATPLKDGMQVYVPRLAQPTPVPVSPVMPTAGLTRPPSGVAAGTAVPGNLIDLNTATLEELDTLPGVGPATAQKIIEGRPYGAIEDLLRVKGIGQATFDKLKGLITVR
jgi:competence protein ComEA